MQRITAIITKVPLLGLVFTLGACATMEGDYGNRSPNDSNGNSVEVVGTTTGSGEQFVNAALVTFTIDGRQQHVPVVSEGVPAGTRITESVVPVVANQVGNYVTATRVAELKRCGNGANCGTVIQNSVNPVAIADSESTAVVTNEETVNVNVGGLCSIEQVAAGTCQSGG